jgi:hypothetical protein
LKLLCKLFKHELKLNLPKIMQIILIFISDNKHEFNQLK